MYIMNGTSRLVLDCIELHFSFWPLDPEAVPVVEGKYRTGFIERIKTATKLSSDSIRVSENYQMNTNHSPAIMRF